MAIIAPSRNFQGSSTDDVNDFSVIKPSIRTLKIDKKNNTTGVMTYFLPSYKVDDKGFGVWFNIIEVRTQFGDKIKGKYVVKNKAQDPAYHFERRFKHLYPEEAKTEKDESGYTQHLPYGHITKRVLYNVCIKDKFQEGSMVLELPSYMGGDQINKYHNTKQPDGSFPALICDPDLCTPVFLKLDRNQWQIQFYPTYAAKLPEEFLDYEKGYIYDLDTVTVEKDKESILDTLRESFSADVFSRCIEGFDDNIDIVTRQLPPSQSLPPAPPQYVAPTPAPVQPILIPQIQQMPVQPIQQQQPLVIPQANVAPVVAGLNIPKVGQPAPSAAPLPAAQPTNPMRGLSSQPVLSQEAALAMLRGA